MTSLRHNPVCPDDVILGKDQPHEGGEQHWHALLLIG